MKKRGYDSNIPPQSLGGTNKREVRSARSPDVEASGGILIQEEFHQPLHNWMDEIGYKFEEMSASAFSHTFVHIQESPPKNLHR